MAGLKAMQGATAGLHSADVAGSNKATAATLSNSQKKVLASKAYVESQRSSTREIARANVEASKAMSKTSTAVAHGLSSQRYLFHDLSRQMALYSVGLAAPTIATVAAAGKWEDAFANVRRTADPAFEGVERKVQGLRTSLVDMVQAMPVSFAEVTEIATLGNQMGVASTQIADFTRATAMFAATSGVSVEQSATAFGRLTSIMGDGAIGFTQMADSILKVGVNSVATESEIINVTTQISSIAAGAKFSTEEMIGLSGALASVRVPPELSRGLVTRVFGQFDKAVSSGGAELNTLARLSGRTASQFREDWTSGGGGAAFTDFLKGIKDAGPEARKEIESLGIKSVRDVPVLLRLANAADSDGKAGGLLTQTMNDAQNAAGETQRQYTIMAETIWAKIKVLGNNIVSVFDAIGQSNLGMFGDVLDNLTSGIRSFSDSLGEPMKILGAIELPWTNAEALGFVTTLSLAAAGLTAVGSAALKVGAGAVGLKQLSQVMSGGSMIPWLLGTKGAGGKAGRVGAAAEIAATTAAMSATRPVLNSMKSGAAAAGTAWANLGRSVGIARNQFGKGVGPEPFKYMAKDIPPVTGALGNLTRIGLHPATLGLAALTAAGVTWANLKFGESTSVKDFSEQLASLDPNKIEGLNRAVSNLEVSGLKSTLFGLPGADNFNKSTVKPFENGVDDIKAAMKEITSIYEGSKVHEMMGGGLNDIVFGDRINKADQRAALEGIGVMDKSIQNLMDAGNNGQALSTVMKMVSSGKELKALMDLDEGAASKSLISTLFNASDFEMTEKNLDKLINGQLPELTDAMFGAGITKTSELFDGDGAMEQAVKYQEALDTASAAFVSFGDSMTSATKVDAEGAFQSFDLSAFSKGLADSVLAQEAWQADMEVIAKNTTTGVVEELANLGPEAAEQVGAIADALRSKDPEMRQAGEDLIAQMEAGVESKLSGFGGTIGQIMADQAWLRGALGDAGFADFISKSLTSDELGTLREAGRNASDNVIKGVMEGLSSGTISLDQAIDALESNVPVDTYIRNNEAAKDLQALVSEKFNVEVPVDLSKDSAVGDLKALVNDAELNKIQINSELSLEDAYAQVPAFKAWADSQGISFDVDADTAPAKGKVDALDAEAEAPVSKPVDADTAAADGKLLSLGTLAAQPAVKPVDADDKPALAKILALAGIVTSSVHNHTINVKEVRTFETLGVPFKPGNRLLAETDPKFMADGGTVAYYANGGVRENHVAQIAPAGAMRMWAEPETGGEAYIPLAESKRKRSLAILGDVANRFGVALSSNVSRYADGGEYNAQRFSRASAFGSATENTQFNLGGVTFAAASQKNQFREFERSFKRIKRRI